MTTTLYLFSAIRDSGANKSYYPVESENYVYEGFDKLMSSYKNSSSTSVLKRANFQYIRPELEITFKVNLTQEEIFTNRQDSRYFYAEIDYPVDLGGGNTGTDIYYYFIKKMKQISPMCIEFTCKMDVLNTFGLDPSGQFDPDYNMIYDFKPHSVIKRCHRDRFIRTKEESYTQAGITRYITRYRKVVDKFPENINPILFKVKEEYLTNGENTPNSWYIIYANSTDPANPNDTESKYINPIEIMFASDDGYKYSTSTATTVTLYPQADEIPDVINMVEIIAYRKQEFYTGGNIVVGGTTYDETAITDKVLFLVRQNNTDTQFKAHLYDNSTKVTTLLGNVSSVDITNVSNGWIFYQPLMPTSYDFRVNGQCLINNSATYQYTFFNVGSGAGTLSHVEKSIADLDLTDPRLVKIICLPYAPISYLKNLTDVKEVPTSFSYNSNFGFLQWNGDNIPSLATTLEFDRSPYGNTQAMLQDVSDDISSSIYFKESSLVSWTSSTYPIYTRKMKHETKLANSEFSCVKFVYDSFSFTFKNELLRLDKTSVDTLNEFYRSTFAVEYAVSPNVSSKFVFVFKDYVCQLEEQDYNNVLLVERNNEVPLYTNAYLNYLRTGFNFDSKQAERKNAVNWAMVGLQITGAVASYIAGRITGNGFAVTGGIALTTSAISKIIGNVESAKSMDEAIKNKMLQASTQSETVSGNDDITLFKFYSNNKAKFCYYEMSDYMKNAVYDLFWYSGYACNNTLVSEGKMVYDLVHTRKFFNFIQGDMIINIQDMDEDIKEEIENKYKEGVTFLHDVKDDYGDELPYWFTPSELYYQDIENIEKKFTLS